MRPLPPLNGIKAFESAARLGGFASAGNELHVSPTAVSRLVKGLENRLGVALFERRANKLDLTHAGEAYLAGLTPLLDELSRLSSSVKRGHEALLTIGVGQTFAMRWLIPRLASFKAHVPDLEVRLATGGMSGAYKSDWTCGIKLGDGHFTGLASEVLFDAFLKPVCRMELKNELGDPSKLDPRRLIRVAHAADDWTRWYEAAGCRGVSALGPVFENYGQAIQAAADGLGIAMGIEPYINDDLAAGRLAAPFDAVAPKGSSWYLIYENDRIRERAFRMFRHWIFVAAGCPRGPALPEEASGHLSLSAGADKRLR